MGHLQKEMEGLVIQLGHGQRGGLNNVFASIFTSRASSHTQQITEGKGSDWGNEEPHSVKEEQVPERLRNVKMYKQPHGT